MISLAISFLDNDLDKVILVKMITSSY